MYKLGLKTIMMTVGLCLAGQAVALPFTSFDARSFAMGGTGVASGTSSNAVFFNPALLAAASEDEDFSLDVPVMGARFSDPDDLISAADDFSQANYVANFNNALDQETISPSPSNELALQNAAQALSDGLVTLSDKAVQFDGAVAGVMGIPSKNVGISVFANAYVVGGGVAHYSAADKAQLDSIIADPTAWAATNCTPTCAYTLTSSVDGRFLMIREIGVSVAHEFSIADHTISVGVTPKLMKATSYDYTFSGNSLDNSNIDINTNEKSETTFDLDVGVAKEFGNGWKTGFAVKNLVSHDFTTYLGNTITVNPQARIGISHQTDWTTVALDVDLTENDPAGLEYKTQYVGLGAEFDVLDTVQLRVGYRNNLSDTGNAASDTISAGIGFSPFGVHFDFAAAGNSDEVGAALQFGFRF